jgi:hypothetical protein
MIAPTRLEMLMPRKLDPRLMSVLLALALAAGWAGVTLNAHAAPDQMAQRACIDKVSASQGATDDDGALEAAVGDCSVGNV